MFIKSIEVPLLRLRQCHSSLFAFFFFIVATHADYDVSRLHNYS